MDEKEIRNVYAIPANYTDSGKILGGMVEPRNAVETVFLLLLVGYPELMLIPMPGTIRIVVTGVFVALDGGVDCLCSYPKRGRPPRGARVTVRILGLNMESNRIWGAITHIAAPR